MIQHCPCCPRTWEEKDYSGDEFDPWVRTMECPGISLTPEVERVVGLLQSAIVGAYKRKVEPDPLYPIPDSWEEDGKTYRWWPSSILLNTKQAMDALAALDKETS